MVLGPVRLRPPAPSAASTTLSTSARLPTPKQYSAGVCVLASATGSFADSANFSRPSSITNACSPAPGARLPL